MKNIEKHWMNTIINNANKSLVFAKALNDMPYKTVGDMNGIHSLVKVINAASIQLMHCCKSKEYQIADEKESI